MKQLSIVIVTYRSRKHIIDCLESIYKYNDIGDTLEVIIVENNSEEKDLMFEDIRSRFNEQVTLINSGANVGYGTGNNIGIKACTSPYVIVMNPDVRLVCPIFKDVIEALNKPRVGMIGVDFVDGSPAYYFKKEYRTVFKSVFLRLYLWRRKYNSKTMFMSGSFFAFNKEAFNKAGRFDENIFMYSEEADITNRMLSSGYKVEWCPQIKVLHLAHGREYNEKLHKIRMESGKYYDEKYNLDSEKIYKIEVKALKIDLFISKMLFMRNRAEGIRQTLNTVVNSHNNLQ